MAEETEVLPKKNAGFDVDTVLNQDGGASRGIGNIFGISSYTDSTSPLGSLADQAPPNWRELMGLGSDPVQLERFEVPGERVGNDMWGNFVGWENVSREPTGEPAISMHTGIVPGSVNPGPVVPAAKVTVEENKEPSWFRTNVVPAIRFGLNPVGETLNYLFPRTPNPGPVVPAPRYEVKDDKVNDTTGSPVTTTTITPPPISYSGFTNIPSRNPGDVVYGPEYRVSDTIPKEEPPPTIPYYLNPNVPNTTPYGPYVLPSYSVYDTKVPNSPLPYNPSVTPTIPKPWYLQSFDDIVNLKPFEVPIGPKPVDIPPGTIPVNPVTVINPPIKIDPNVTPEPTTPPPSDVKPPSTLPPNVPTNPSDGGDTGMPSITPGSGGRNLLNEGRSTLDAYNQLYPGLLDLYTRASGGYSNADAARMAELAGGKDYAATQEYLNKLAQDQTLQANRALREGNLADAENLAARAAKLRQDANPELYAAMEQFRNAATGQVKTDLDRLQQAQSGQLSPEDLRNAQQSAREAYAARGLVMGPGAIGAEIMNRDALARQRQQEARQNLATSMGQLSQGVGQYTANVFDPLAATLSQQYGMQSSNVGNTGQMFGQVGNLASGAYGNQMVNNLYNPWGAYPQDVYNTNFNAMVAQQIAAANNAAAIEAARQSAGATKDAANTNAWAKILAGVGGWAAGKYL